MDVALGRWLLPLLCGALVAAAGCAPWGSKVKKDDPNGVSGVISPTQQICDLRDLAKTAPAKNAYEKQLIEQQLAGQIKHEQDPLIRAQIVRTLGEYPSATSDVVLRAAVKDADNDVRLAACDAWAKRDTVEAATILAGVLNSDVDHDVRLAAARAMAQSHQQVAINALGDALEDKDPAMQYQAVLSLRQITGQDLGNDVNRWRQYAKSNQLHPAKPVSLAERIWHPF
jgi:HEAT repeat protein